MGNGTISRAFFKPPKAALTYYYLLTWQALDDNTMSCSCIRGPVTPRVDSITIYSFLQLYVDCMLSTIVTAYPLYHYTLEGDLSHPLREIVHGYWSLGWNQPVFLHPEISLFEQCGNALTQWSESCSDSRGWRVRPIHHQCRHIFETKQIAIMAGSAYRVSLYSMSSRKLTFCKFEQLDRSSYRVTVECYYMLSFKLDNSHILRLCHSDSLPFNYYHVYYVFAMLTAMHQLLSIEQFLCYLLTAWRKASTFSL